MNLHSIWKVPLSAPSPASYKKKGMMLDIGLKVWLYALKRSFVDPWWILVKCDWLFYDGEVCVSKIQLEIKLPIDSFISTYSWSNSTEWTNQFSGFGIANFLIRLKQKLRHWTNFIAEMAFRASWILTM